MPLPLAVLLNEIRRTDDQTGREERGHVGVGVEYCPHCSERRAGGGRAQGGLKGEAVGVSGSDGERGGEELSGASCRILGGAVGQ